ncbi:MAG: hypothetical protein JO251_18005 [Verrucomicrobia bacterium]|nr:hypothetical protein [Verrucomicrobiota bacterium]
MQFAYKHWLLRAIILPVLLAAESASAQDSIRPSLAGELDAASRRPVIDTSSYNLKLGPALVNLSAHLDFEYNDNINLAETGRESDLIIRPSLFANVLWQISEVNALRLNLGVGYIKYLIHSQFDSSSLVVAPQSELAFDIYVGDFRFTIFDQLAILQNPVDEINLSRVARFERIENSAGLSVTWDLDRLVLFCGFTHYNFYSIDSQFDFLNRAEEQGFLSADLKLSDVLSVGARGTFASVNYSENFQNDSSNYSAGVFADTRLTRYLIVSAEAGYQKGHFNGGGLNVDNSQLSSPYFRLRLDHRLNQYWTESLLAGYEAQLGFTTNSTELAFVHYSANWRVNSRATVSLDAFYEHGLDSAGTVQVEDINRVGFGVSCFYTLGKRFALNAGYGFIDRLSDLAGHSYRQSRVTFGINYAF